MGCNEVDISKVLYRCSYNRKSKTLNKSISVIGVDTEADNEGRCFLMCTSLGDSFDIADFPACFFSSKYRGKTFVAYNLKYDEGALLQFLPEVSLKELYEKGKVKYDNYKIKCIPKKYLSIRKSNHTITFYDIYNFYNGSLEYNSKKYLGKSKVEMETHTFTCEYIRRHKREIKRYCTQDAILVKELADLIIKRFESFGVYPRRLYSTAYVSWQYFKKNCNIVTVKKFWNEDKKLLSYAMASYNGGKFEVTEKGTGTFYEYDINSAYPYEIANLVDVSHSRVVWSTKSRKSAIYGFIFAKIKLPLKINSPIAVKKNSVNLYPTGYIEKVITKNEYDYLISQNCDITIIDAVWVHIDKKEFPYKKEIEKLMVYKNQFKKENRDLDYHTIKILLNSLYGKFCQLIKNGEFYNAGTSWNPIYASVITANVRLRVSKMQREYTSIIAVHTDSVISKSPLSLQESNKLGDFSPVISGKGLILGSGIYQIGDHVKFRGFDCKLDLFKMVDTNKKTVDIMQNRPYTWKEVMFHGWDTDKINQFTDIKKTISCNFDRKRIWLNDWCNFREVLKRNVESLPYFYTSIGV